MRQPYQTLVFPYKRDGNEFKYAIFLRKDFNIWQAISGGGEEGEKILETAKRECFEEAQIDPNSEYMELDSMCTIPVVKVRKGFFWGDDVFVVKEHSFGVNVEGQELILGDEHNEIKWASYEEAKELLKFDSNKNALWELNERLKRTL